jgi:hypothetical protein
MSDTSHQLEARIARLEEEVRQLRSCLSDKRTPGGWEEIIGTHKGDKIFEEMVREMRKNRRADYAAARTDPRSVAEGQKPRS